MNTDSTVSLITIDADGGQIERRDPIAPFIQSKKHSDFLIWKDAFNLQSQNIRGRKVNGNTISQISLLKKHLTESRIFSGSRL